MVGELSENGMIGEMDGIVAGVAGSISGLPRLGVRIHPIRDNDSTKTYYGTLFPVATMVASSWNTVLFRKVSVALGDEMKAYGIDIALALV